jgi:prophage endopeptidase
MNQLRNALYAAGAALIVGSYLAVFWLGHHIAAQSCDLADTRAQLQSVEDAQTKSRELATLLTHISEQADKEKADAKKQIDDLRARVLTGRVRVTLPAARCETVVTASGNREARAELDESVANDLINIAADGDDATRDLNECVDKYNAARQKLESQ